MGIPECCTLINPKTSSKNFALHEKFTAFLQARVVSMKTHGRAKGCFRFCRLGTYFCCRFKVSHIIFVPYIGMSYQFQVAAPKFEELG